MRSIEEVRRVEALVAAGHTTAEICRITGIPWSTVRGWRTGRTRRAATSGCGSCGHHCLPIRSDIEPAYAYLLGQYLGDGGIYAHRRGVHRLVIFSDAQYHEVTAEIARAIAAVMPGVSVGRTDRRGCARINAYSRSWPCLFPQHGPGPKHLRPIELTPWQQAITARHPEPFLRGLIHSDGCRSVNEVRTRGRTYRYPRYSFSNRSDDIRRIFCDHLDLLGIPWRRMNRWNISVARREGVARLDEFVGPKR